MVCVFSVLPSAIDYFDNYLFCVFQRLPSAVSEDLCLSIHNLRDVSLQNLRCEVTNMKTIAEKNGNGYMYGFSKWSAFLKSNQIHIGATLFFKYVKASQLLILTKLFTRRQRKEAVRDCFHLWLLVGFVYVLVMCWLLVNSRLTIGCIFCDWS
ncbi:putative transcription factor B3-Domain family [Helianthus annuus]|nr:putative transcription factor B3-Domain family [Helianthus annuus]KAJ0701139.1 putative transcription factor B3-Domain family [Helianthus annuus]